MGVFMDIGECSPSEWVCSDFPKPNLICQVTATCPGGYSSIFNISSYAYTSLENSDTQYLAKNHDDIVLYVSQIKYLNANDFIIYSYSSSFSLEKVRMFELTTATEYYPTISTGNNYYIKFTSVLSKLEYYFWYTFDFGKAFSNSVYITVIKCAPSITLSSSYSKNLSSPQSELSVFITQDNLSDDQPSYCTNSFSLYDSTGNIQQPSTTSTYSFNQLTGELKIINFNQYFNENFIVKVRSTFKQDASFYEDISSVKINVLYQIDCSPIITQIGKIYNNSIPVALPYSVFITSATTNNPTYCKITSYTLLNFSGNPYSSSQFSFSSTTGEFKINYFSGLSPDAYFNDNFIVKVYSNYISGQQVEKSEKTTVFNIQYSKTKIVECKTLIGSTQNFIGYVTSIAQLKLFSVSEKFSPTVFPEECQLSYSIQSSTGKTQISDATMSFDSTSGQYWIKSFPNNIFEQTIIIKITSSFQVSSDSVLSGTIIIRKVYCKPSIYGLSSVFNYSINTLSFPYTVFKAQTYSSTANTDSCTLSYQLNDKNGATITSDEFMNFNQQNGEFQIKKYQQKTILQFEKNLTLFITSTYTEPNSSGVTISQSISVNIYTCFPSIDDEMILPNYSYTVGPTISPNNSQKIIIITAGLYTHTASRHIFCKLTYELYFQSGLKASVSNSQLIQIEDYIGLDLISNQGFISTYYFRAISTSVNPAYSNSVDSQPFQVIVKSDPSVVYKSPIIKFNQTFNYGKYQSKANIEYLESGSCSIQNTTIRQEGFDPNFIIYYQSGSSIQVDFKNFTTNNSLCPMYSHYIKQLNNNELPEKCSQISWSGNIQYFNFDLSNVIFGQAYKFKIVATAAPHKQEKVSISSMIIQDYQMITQEAQITVYRNCSIDKVYQNLQMPFKNESYFSSYKQVDGNPVLFLNISQNENAKVDIRQRFKNNFPESCSLNYQITEIHHNELPINMSLTNEFIQLAGNGILSIKSQQWYAFNNYHILIVAYNQADLYANVNGYLVDLSIYQVKQQQLTNQLNITKKNKKIKMSKNQACTGFISSVSQNGQAKIIFSDIMNTNINISHINKTNTQMYLKPGGNRQLDDNFDPSTLNFTWFVASFVKETMLVNLIFNQPQEISPMVQQDQLIVNFNGSQNLIYCINKKSSLNEDYSVLKRNVPSQITSEDSSLLSGIGTSGSVFSNGPIWLLAVGGVVVLLGYGNMVYYTIYVRSLQFLLLLPAIPIVLQANVIGYFNMIKTVATYDILSYIQIWNLPVLNKVIVDTNPPVLIISQMQDIGYSSRNCVYSLGTFTFIIYLYFIRLGLITIFKIIQKILKKRCKKNKQLKQLESGLFYNNIYGMAIEGMIEFLINGYLNLKTAQISTNGEIMGVTLSGFCIFVSSTVLPSAVMWMICFKSKKQLQAERFEGRHGALFEGVNLKWNSSRIYFFVFWARRMLSVCLSLLTNQKMGSAILAFILIFNIIYTVYIGCQRRLKNIYQNYQEMFNELIVSGCYYMMMTQSDWVPFQSQKYLYGFMLTYLVIFYSFANILLILYVNFKSIQVVVEKYYNLLNHIFKEKQQPQQNKKQKNDENLQIENKDENVENPNILLLQNNKQIQKEQESIEDILNKQNQKVNDIFDRVIEQIQLQKSAKKQEKLKWQKENQANTLKNLIEKPKKFLEPQLNKINEELEMIESPKSNMAAISSVQALKKIIIDKSSAQLANNPILNESALQNKYNVQMKADEFMKKHKDLQKIDSDGSLKKSIESLFKFINSQQSEEIFHGQRQSELDKIKNVLKIDLILLKSSQSYKDYKFWEKKISLFEQDFNKLLNGIL